MRTLTSRCLAAALLLAPMAGHAQGALSVLGFGYPTGQLSTRALGAGGALGETDPLSASNPAAIGYLGGSAVYFQADPEYRTLHVGGATESTSIARFPLIVASFPVAVARHDGDQRLESARPQLRDLYARTAARWRHHTGDVELVQERRRDRRSASRDRMGTDQLAPRRRALHAISGDNRIQNTQIFDDSIQFARLIDTATVGYTGSAASAGFELFSSSFGSIAGSYRRGGSLSLKRGDTTIAKAHVPDRLAISAAFSGIKGLTIAVRTAQDKWSAMQALGSTSLRATDSWDTSAGIDAMGPKWQEKVIQLRAGARWRTLPFGTATSNVTEKSYSVGAGTLMARGRAALDLAAIRATRDAGAGLSETSTTLSIGVTVRP